MSSDDFRDGEVPVGRHDLAVDIDDSLEHMREAMRGLDPFEAADMVRHERDRATDGGAGR